MVSRFRYYTAGYLRDFVLTCSNDQLARLSHANSGAGVAMIVGHSHVVETVKFLPSLQANKILDEYITKTLNNFLQFLWSY